MGNPFQNVVHIQIRRRWVSLRFFGWNGAYSEWEGVPQCVVASRKDGKSYALATDDPRILNALNPRAFVAFGHPRVLVDDLESTALTLAVLLRNLRRKRLVLQTFILQVTDEWTGGISEPEQRALCEVAKRLGANRILFLYRASELSAPEIIALGRSATPSGPGIAVLNP